MEGEGSFSWYRGYPLVSIEMTDRDVIDKFAELFRDPEAKRYQNVMRRENKQIRKDGTQRLDSYRYSTNSRPAIRIMLTLYPFMGERRQARIREIVLQWRSHPYYECPGGDWSLTTDSERGYKGTGRRI